MKSFAMKQILIVFGMLVLTIVVMSMKVCLREDKFPPVTRQHRLPIGILFSLTTDGLAACTQVCLTVPRCTSFNFNNNSGLCELNKEAVGSGNITESDLIPNAEFFFSNIHGWPQRITGVCSNHTCSPNEYCVRKSEAVAECKIYAPSSCQDVKTCQPDSSDGEYWIQLLNFDFYRTRIYCHNMTSSHPQEYLTLPKPNYGIFPPITNIGCNVEWSTLIGNCEGRGGDSNFTKLHVNIMDMSVYIADFTFAYHYNEEMQFGQAVDCYTSHDDGQLASCGTKGRFYIDMAGTGWIVNPQQEWTAGGWKFVIETIERDTSGATIVIKCGGYPGYCTPKIPMTLIPRPDESLPDSSATEVAC